MLNEYALLYCSRPMIHHHVTMSDVSTKVNATSTMIICEVSKNVSSDITFLNNIVFYFSGMLGQLPVLPPMRRG